jgi:hypothetical protein
MKARSKWNSLAAIVGVSGLIAAAALVPGAQAATAHRCGNRSVTLEIATGEVGAKPEILKTTIKSIVAQGLTCSAADKFLSALFKDHTSTPPQHFKCAIGHFKAPAGYVPEVCTHKGMKVQYAGPGG